MLLPPVLRNPIFQKDFVSLCRTKRWFVLRTLVIALLVASLWLALYSASFDRSTTQDTIGQILFATLAIVELILICLLVPGLVSDLIVGERRKETLEILLVTSMRPLGILLGKFLSRVALVFVIVAASFPLLAVSLLYGGVRGDQILSLFFVYSGTILFLAGVGLLVSTFARRLGTAAVLAYIIPVVWLVGQPVLAMAISDGGREQQALNFLARTHPLFATVTLVVDELYTDYLIAQSAPWNTFSLLGSGFAVLAIALSWLRLVRERNTRGFGGRVVDRDAEAIADLTRLRGMVAGRLAAAPEPDLRGPLDALLPEIDACLASIRGESDGAAVRTVSQEVRSLQEKVRTLGLSRDPGIRDGTERARTGRRRRAFRSRLKNPMLWKEVHLVNASHSRVLFFVCAGILLLTTAIFFAFIERDIDEGESHIVLVTAEAFVLLLLVAVNSATSVVGEREQGTLDLVHVTLVTPAEIVYAKLLGTFRSVLVLALIPVSHIFLATAVSDLPVVAAVLWTLILFVMFVFFAVAGLGASIASIRPSRAILRSIGGFVAVVFGPPLLWMLLMLVSQGDAGDFAVFWLMADPFALLGAVPAWCIPATPSDWQPANDPDTTYHVFAGVWGFLYLAATAGWFVALPERYQAHRRKSEGAVTG